jgi:phage shock protein E
MGLLDLLTGKKTKLIKEALEEGAAIIDVRTPSEFKMGNVDGSINLPLNKVQSSINKIKKINKPILVCCASGMRSAQAASIMQNAGISNVINAGSWSRIYRLI